MDPSASPKFEVSAVVVRSVLQIAIVALAIFALSSATARADSEPAGPSVDIINGTVVPNSPTEWPFIVALLQNAGNGASQYCGGSLIKADWVLTAAHCVDTASGGVIPGGILYGRKNLIASGGQVLGVSAVYVHPNYDPNLIANDIALIKLSSAPSSPVTITTATTSDDPPTGAALEAAGWGATAADGSTYPNDLYEAGLSTVSNFNCSLNWGNGAIFASNICASASPSDTCFGDSGGPLVYNTVGGPRLVGIVSWGSDPCAQAALPGVYTRVSSFASFVSGYLGKSITPDVAQLDFGTSSAGSAAVKRTVTFASTGDDPISISSATITAGADFSITGGDCVGATLLSGSTCEVQVAFNPATPGVRGGELTLGTNGSGSSTTKVSLQGIVTGQIVSDVALNLRMPKRSKAAKKRGKIKSELFVSYKIPAGSNAALSCAGSMRMSMKVPGYRKAFVKGANVYWSNSGCTAKFIYALPKRVRGKRATVTTTFTGNGAVRATSLTAKQRIR